MNLHQLLVFRTIAEEGSFRGAADKLFLSQPSVSQQIAALEREYAVRLFDRKGRTIALTPEGRALHILADDLLRAADEIPVRFRALKTLQAGRISILSSSFGANVLLPHPVVTFARDFPSIALSITTIAADRITAAIKEGGAELAVLGRPFLDSRDRDITYRTLGRDRLVMVASPLLLRNGESELATEEETFIRFARNCQPVDHVDEFILRHRIRFGASIEVNEIETANRLAAEGAGITITSLLSVRGRLDAGDLAIIPFPDGEELFWEVQCLFPAYRGLSHAGWEMVKRIEAHCAATLS
jgi:DNA-binding transcriptional LysR family regulator